MIKKYLFFRINAVLRLQGGLPEIACICNYRQSLVDRRFSLNWGLWETVVIWYLKNNKMEKLRREWKKSRSKFMSDANIKECFHFDKESCNGKIKNAHSLQKNGVLSILEYEINKNKVVYSFLHPKLSGFMTFNGFEPIGKNNASTFHGFCDYHDSVVFSPIENNEVDIESDEHCFLLSYRSFAKEYHAKIEVNKGYKNN